MELHLAGGYFAGSPRLKKTQQIKNVPRGMYY